MIYLEFFFIEKPINRNEIVIRKVIVSSHKLRCAFFFSSRDKNYCDYYFKIHSIKFDILSNLLKF